MYVIERDRVHMLMSYINYSAPNLRYNSRLRPICSVLIVTRIAAISETFAQFNTQNSAFSDTIIKLVYLLF